ADARQGGLHGDRSGPSRPRGFRQARRGL
ncbi:MAG: hypothetical protein AVDCRST_MAG87-1798, partial [uncultured Thermomicrobiales bacterium]